MNVFELNVPAFEEGPQRGILKIARLAPWNSRKIKHEALLDQIIGVDKCAVVLINAFYLFYMPLLKGQPTARVVISCF